MLLALVIINERLLVGIEVGRWTLAFLLRNQILVSDYDCRTSFFLEQGLCC